MERDGDLDFRLADPGADEATLGLLLAEMLEHYNPGRLRPPEAAGSRAAAILQAWPGCEVLIAWQAGKPLAMAAFSMVFPAEGVETQMLMKDLFVTRDARSQGIGERLLRALARLAAERGGVRLDWTTDAGNAGALAFYDRIGAERIRSKVYFRFDAAALRAFAEGGEGKRG